MPIHETTDRDFAAHTQHGTVLVDFSTRWCAPCRALLPVLQALAKEGVEVRTIDAEDNRRLAELYDIRSFPTVIAFKDGRPTKRMVGLVGLGTRDRLLALLV